MVCVHVTSEDSRQTVSHIIQCVTGPTGEGLKRVGKLVIYKPFPLYIWQGLMIYPRHKGANYESDVKTGIIRPC